MNFFIGIDGGGTKTHCILSDSNLNILAETYGGPSNFLIIGTETVCKTLVEIIEKVISIAKVDGTKIKSILLGSTGAGRQADALHLQNAFKNYCLEKNITLPDFFVESDAVIALEGAFSGNPGAIMIAGTGSIMFGKDSNGNIHRVGGFGRLIGDEGSGYIIGREGLTSVARYFDGRNEKNLIVDLLNEKFNISNMESLINQVYKYNFDIASVAPLVIEAAELGDKEAIKIIGQQSGLLVNHVTAMTKKLNTEIFPLSFVGGLLSNKNFYSNRVIELLNKKHPQVLIKNPDYPPEIGAVLLAIKKSK